jgi:hypothetical protein
VIISATPPRVVTILDAGNFNFVFPSASVVKEGQQASVAQDSSCPDSAGMGLSSAETRLDSPSEVRSDASLSKEAGVGVTAAAIIVSEL